MADFSAAAVSALFDAQISLGKSLAPFKHVLTHEPKSPPTDFPALAIWWVQISPAAAASGMGAVSGVVTFTWRVYQSTMLSEPQNLIDPGLLKNTALCLQALSAAFTLGGTVRDVDLLGAHGTPLAAKSGFISHDRVLLRVADITVPIVINDLFTEVA